MTKTIAIVVLLLILKSLLWVMVVPIFQTPDEQAHFTQLSFMVENKTLLVQTSKNLSLEIAVTEALLGTRRDDQGKGHPPDPAGDTLCHGRGCRFFQGAGRQ
mgnify:CR=1 FL=1